MDQTHISPMQPNQLAREIQTETVSGDIFSGETAMKPFKDVFLRRNRDGLSGIANPQTAQFPSSRQEIRMRPPGRLYFRAFSSKFCRTSAR